MHRYFTTNFLTAVPEVVPTFTIYMPPASDSVP